MTPTMDPVSPATAIGWPALTKSPCPDEELGAVAVERVIGQPVVDDDEVAVARK